MLQPVLGETEEDGKTSICVVKSSNNNIQLRIERDLTQEQISMIDDVIDNHNPIVKIEPTTEEIQIEIINMLGQELAQLKVQLIMGGVL